MSDIFGDRMKEYEAVSDIRLTKKLPLIIRLDGNSFSKLTKDLKLEKPFDERFYNAINGAAKSVLKYCSGSQVAYVQSDEITILLRNDQQPQTEPFLANRLEKICSLVASVCSVTFSNNISKEFGTFIPAVFDCRVFIVPPEEVNNAFLWRQQDAFKNCVSSVAWFGLKKKYGKKIAMDMVHGKNTEEKQELIFKELDINMNDYPTKFKRGVCIHREVTNAKLSEFLKPELIIKYKQDPDSIVTRSLMKVNEDIPIFSQDTNYINDFMKDKNDD